MKRLIVLAAVILSSCGGRHSYTEIRRPCVIDSISIKPPSNNYDISPTYVLYTECNTVYETDKSVFRVGDTVMHVYRR